jgi:hypothetical protein
LTRADHQCIDGLSNNGVFDMLSEREEITHALDHALTAIAALRSAGQGDAIILGQIEDAMDAAYRELTRAARPARRIYSEEESLLSEG